MKQMMIFLELKVKIINENKEWKQSIQAGSTLKSQQGFSHTHEVRISQGSHDNGPEPFPMLMETPKQKALFG